MIASGMPSNARVWVYQSSRFLTPAEQEKIRLSAGEFIRGWTAHDQDLFAAFDIRYDLFLVLMIDEEKAMASGCSIDKSVHFIQGLEKTLQTEFMNRMLIAYRDNGRLEIATRNEFEKLAASGIVTEDTIVFNNLVHTLRELEEQWEVPLKNSWHQQLI